MKWPLFLAVGACGDALLPPAASGLRRALGLMARGGRSGGSDERSQGVSFERVRPALADPAIEALVPTPASASFPSGHAATAFAAAVAVGAFYPRLRWPLLGLAALVGLSRIYLGVHYVLDVLAGAALGLALGLLMVWATRRLLGWLGRSGMSLRGVGTSFAPSRRSQG